MALKLVYKDVAPEAKQDIESIEFSQSNPKLSDMSVLLLDNIKPVRYATMEENQWRLDGTYNYMTEHNVPFISKAISNETITDTEKGLYYALNPMCRITRIFRNKHKSSGISFVFDYPDYCGKLTVIWYNDEKQVGSATAYPDSTEYYIEYPVEAFNKITITFNGMNKPNRYLKVWSIDDGTNRIYTNKDVLSIDILEEISLISEKIPSNTLDLTLKNTTDTDLMFQKNQPFTVYNNDDIVGVFYIDNAERPGKYTYSIHAQDYKGVLENNLFYGGIYVDELAGKIIEDIFEDENILLEIDDATYNTKLSGYLKIDTKRSALMQVLFATCSVCNTAGTDKFKIFKLPNNSKQIDSARIKSGGSVKNSPKLTSVKLSVHNYVKDTESKEIYSGDVLKGENTIQFTNPIDTESISISKGSLKVVHPNYCVIETDQDTDITIEAVEYIDNVTIEEMSDKNKLFGQATEVKEITDATLVSKHNSKAVLTNVYNYYSMNSTLETDIHIINEEVGDRVYLHTEWSGIKKGRLEQLDYSIGNKKIGKVVQRISNE